MDDISISRALHPCSAAFGLCAFEDRFGCHGATPLAGISRLTFSEISLADFAVPSQIAASSRAGGDHGGGGRGVMRQAGAGPLLKAVVECR